MPKIAMSFEQSRKHLLTSMTAKHGKKRVDTVVHFRNKEVPSFLRNLDSFEQKSRRGKLLVK